MLNDFHEGFPALNNATMRNFANWTPQQREEYQERKKRAENILKAIRQRRESARDRSNSH